MQRTRGKHIPDETWNLHEYTIRRLYVEERTPLTATGGLMDIMREEYGFTARFV
jgi:hypothetical protein